jgi:hypothetical protein
MKKPEQSSSEFVVCINNAEYPASLELHKIYRVVPDTDAAADGDIRIILPAIFPPSVQQAVEESLLRAS